MSYLKTPDLSGINNEIEALKEAIESSSTTINLIAEENTKTKTKIDDLLISIEDDCVQLNDYLENESKDLIAVKKLVDELIANDEIVIETITAENTKTKGEIDALLTAIKGECAKFKNYVDSELGNQAAADHQHIIADITDLKDATPTTHGLMSAADKEKLDEININLKLSVSDAQLLLSPITQLKISDVITNESLNLHANILNQKIEILARALGLAN